jgi:predicted MPP superfamily phosphohydrolase
LEAQGIRMLINHGQLVAINGSEVLIGGVDDPYLGHDDPDQALTGGECASLRILVAHAPDVVKDLGIQLPELILAGHTHGGQIRLPFVGPLWLHSRHPQLGISDGYYGPEQLSTIADRDLSNTHMFVCRGLGGSGIRARFLCRPQIVFLTLRARRPKTGSWTSSQEDGSER